MEAILTEILDKTTTEATVQTWLTDGISPDAKAAQVTARTTYVADLDRRIGALR